MNVEINIIGCDDKTAIKMNISDNELDFLDRLCKLSKDVSEYSCMPVIEYDIKD